MDEYGGRGRTCCAHLCWTWEKRTGDKRVPRVHLVPKRLKLKLKLKLRTLTTMRAWSGKGYRKSPQTARVYVTRHDKESESGVVAAAVVAQTR